MLDRPTSPPKSSSLLRASMPAPGIAAHEAAAPAVDDESSSFALRLYVFALVAHALAAPAFLHLGSRLGFSLDLVCIVADAATIALHRAGRRGLAAAVLVATAAPHIAFCLVVFGHDTGLELYLLALTIVVMTAPWKLAARVTTQGLVAIAAVALYTWTYEASAPLPPPRGEVPWLFALNALGSFGVLTYGFFHYRRTVEQAASALRWEASHDALTALPNRREITRVLVREIERSARRDEPVSIALGDIDHFKRVNDTLGHETGDDVIVAVSDVLRRALRTYDTVGRFGGEEFLVVLPGCDEQSAAQAVERIRASIAAERVASSSGPLQTTMSFGVSTTAAPTPGVEPSATSAAESVLRRADLALYRAKREGRNRVVTAAANEADPPVSREGDLPSIRT